MIGCIYKVEAFSRTGKLLMRRYARTKRVAAKMAKRWNDEYCDIRKLHKWEWEYIDLSDVESYCI
jgi:hypothetical protein